MSDSLIDWLALREKADFAARSRVVTDAVVDTLGARPASRPLQIVDLATGTGSNIRYLAPRISRPQRWIAVDRDATLLARVPPHVDTRCLELGTLDGAELFAGRDLVTASALLDLVSPAWIAELADRCRSAGAAVLFALTYNGRFTCDPPEPEDAIVRELFNRHQRSNDKGFGTAAGPDAVACAVRSFAAAGYQVRTEPSDWVLGPDDAALQRALIQGWADAAMEIDPAQSAVVRDWLARRLAHVEGRRSRITVGHDDIAGVI